MLANEGLYAVKKRKRPVHKSCGLKSEPDNGSKSNPSKRHRDRLNGELDRLATLLPFSEEIRARLDKLSVLRLSVGYLKIKNYFTGTLGTNLGVTNAGDNERATSLDGVRFSEGDLLLQALNGFVMVVSTDGFIFYASPTIQDYLGFHQSDVIHQSVLDLVHIDDRDMFRCQLHFALDPKFNTDGQKGSRAVCPSESFTPLNIPPENSSFLERSFCCRLRCLQVNSSGFLMLNFQGRLKYLHRQDQTTEGDASGFSQLALFAIATPAHPPAILEIRTKTLFFQTKHKLDFTPVGIDTRGKVVLGYTEEELCMRGSGYQFIHAADMMYCADKHLRMMKTGESGFTIFRLLSKKRVWIWVQSNARMVFKAGKPDFIICRQKPLTNEEGEEHLYQRQQQLPFNFATGEAVLYETFPSLMTPGPQDHLSKTLLRSSAIHPDSLLGSLLSQDQSVYNQPAEPASKFSAEQVFMDSPALLSVPIKPWSDDVMAHSVQQDSTSQTIPQSLERILGNGGEDGVPKELRLDQEELKEVERALLQLQEVRGEEPIQLNDILANDVFSYVEDALLKESNNHSQSKPGGVDINGHKNYTTGQQLNGVLPSNQMIKCQNSFSGSQKLTGSDLKTIFCGFSGQQMPERVGMNDPQDCLMCHSGIQASFQHSLRHNPRRSLPANTTASFYASSHNNCSSSVQKTQLSDIVLSDPSQNSPHHLPPDVPGRPFFINNQHPVHQGVLPPWQQQHHVIPLTLPSGLQRSDCVQNDCITQNPPVSQHPQDSRSQTELYGPYTINYARISLVSQNSSVKQGSCSNSFSESSRARQFNVTGNPAWPVSGYQRCNMSSNESFSGLHIPGSVDTDCSRPPFPGTSGQSHY